MTFDEIVEDFAFLDDVPERAIQAALDRWDEFGPHLRSLLAAYASGKDLSERTERAMLALIHVIGEVGDTASFPHLCALASHPDRFESALSESGTTLSYPPILISTFDGDPAPLYDLIQNPTADELARGDALLVLAYLVRTGRFGESELYSYLSALPGQLQPEKDDFVWFGYARAVAAMGFIGLSGAVEAIIGRGLIEPGLMTSADFWSDLRLSQDDKDDFSLPVWNGLEPMGSAIDYLFGLNEVGNLDGPDQTYVAAEPVRNPLRNVGRNDPCPCGSGKKYKKCCLQAGLT